MSRNASVEQAYKLLGIAQDANIANNFMYPLFLTLSITWNQRCEGYMQLITCWLVEVTIPWFLSLGRTRGFPRPWRYSREWKQVDALQITSLMLPSLMALGVLWTSPRWSSILPSPCPHLLSHQHPVFPLLSLYMSWLYSSTKWWRRTTLNATLWSLTPSSMYPLFPSLQRVL